MPLTGRQVAAIRHKKRVEEAGRSVAHDAAMAERFGADFAILCAGCAGCVVTADVGDRIIAHAVAGDVCQFCGRQV